MSLHKTEQDLFVACRVLFGQELQYSREFLGRLKKPLIKKAFREKAFATHPDLAAHKNHGVINRQVTLFRRVYESYKNLLGFLATREKELSFPPEKTTTGSGSENFARKTKAGGESADFPYAQGRNKNGKKTNLGSLYNGSLPDRELRIGHFLYYAGITNWMTIGQALIWQKRSRPRVGEIARDLNWLTDDEIKEIFWAQKTGQPYCQAALAMGHLNESQIEDIIRRQSEMQRLFGEFFIERGLLSPEELDKIIIMNQKHNARYVLTGSHSKSLDTGSKLRNQKFYN